MVAGGRDQDSRIVTWGATLAMVAGGKVTSDKGQEKTAHGYSVAPHERPRSQARCPNPGSRRSHAVRNLARRPRAQGGENHTHAPQPHRIHRGERASPAP